jgi:surfeit locus 1 family protein
MNYRFRKPELVPVLFTLFAVGLMFSLGVWQLKRLEWKTKLLADIDQAQSAPPKPLLSYPTARLPDAEWHNITATGTFLYKDELYAEPRYLNEQMGYGVLTPLAVVTPSGTQYVLINRGWVPPEKEFAKDRSAGNPDVPVRVEGVIRKPFTQGRFTPNNVPAKNLWFWYDIPAMAAYTHLSLMPVLIDATRITRADGSAINDAPIPFPVEITIRNDHLGYAITWFAIGISGLVIFVLYYTEKKPVTGQDSI